MDSIKTKIKDLYRIVALSLLIPAVLLNWPALGWAQSGAPSSLQQNTTANRNQVTAPAAPVSQGNDFATLELRDPWDMDQYSDISQYMNESAQRDLIRNVSVADGIFSGYSVGEGITGGNAYFSLLFPGYLEATKAGKIGYRYPIDSAQYHCLYVAMKVDSGAAHPQMGPDVWRVFWFGDQRLNTGGAPYGFGVEALYPEALAAQPTHMWKLYKMDLANPPISDPAFSKWEDLAQWQGLRIDPTVQGDVNFAIDWARLTDCTPTTATISWTPDRSISALWLKPEGAEHYIRIQDGINGASGALELDVQGLQAGEYVVGLGSASSCCISESNDNLVVNATPIVNFISPSYTSGEDYATAVGNTWDFSQDADVTALNNTSGSVQSGALKITTPSGDFPGGDAQVTLNTPASLSTGKYRYLSFRMKTEWDAPWQDVVSGMVGRWIWTGPGRSGDCTLASEAFAIDVGWHTYYIDLHHFFNGAAEAASPVGSPACPPIAYPPRNPPSDRAGNATHWFNTSEVSQLRFDPNENISCAYAEATGRPFIPCSDYRQEIDWIALTAVDEVAKGEPYTVVLDLNKEMDDTNFKVYYTTDISEPRQHRATAYEGSSAEEPAPNARFRLYLPSVFRPTPATNSFEEPTTPFEFAWDTQSVNAGEYYICVEADDGLNASTHCSETPVKVS